MANIIQKKNPTKFKIAICRYPPNVFGVFAVIHQMFGNSLYKSQKVDSKKTFGSKALVKLLTIFVSEWG